MYSSAFRDRLSQRVFRIAIGKPRVFLVHHVPAELVATGPGWCDDGGADDNGFARSCIARQLGAEPIAHDHLPPLVEPVIRETKELVAAPGQRPVVVDR